MAGLGIRLFLDEMINVAVAEELRRRGYDVVACREVGRANQGIPDPAQLAWATDQGRAVLTYNHVDYQRLALQWHATGRVHAGILLSAEHKQPGTLLRAVRAHLDSVAPDTQYNLVLWLPSRG